MKWHYYAGYHLGLNGERTIRPMRLTSHAAPDHTCDVSIDQRTGLHVGQIKFKSCDLGEICGLDLGTIKAQFSAIASLANEGAMVRADTILTGYHDKSFKGDVLQLDGELLGVWESDDFEWCHFTEEGTGDVTLSAPSPWMLQDAIADWLSSERESK